MLLLPIALVGLIITLYLYFNRDYYVLALCRRVKSVDGIQLADKVMVMPQSTIFGHNFDFIDETAASIFDYLRNCVKLTKGKSYLLYFMAAPVYNVVNAEDAKAVLQSTDLMVKGVIYNILVPFLGYGLLTRAGQKWRLHRKMLTPAYHFNILQSFLGCFKEETQQFLTMLGEKQGEALDLSELISQFTLNCICETALGVKLASIDGSGSYRQAVHTLDKIAMARCYRRLMYIPLYFKLFGDYEKQQQAVQCTKKLANAVIEKRRREMEKDRDGEMADRMDEYGKKKRYAMLDTLLHNERKGLINDRRICDEVNTALFGGYDTTSTCITFVLFNLANYPDIQDACYQEVKDLDDMDSLSVFDYNRLEYLECVIKETLRLYPSAPFISRQCVKDTIINGLYLPKNTQIHLHIYDIMRDPRHFAEPTQFRPERFTVENSANRHPFAFVPFSAGPRNCIGQKFALLEIKVLLVAILKKFIIKPVTRLEDIAFENGLILRTQRAIQVKLAHRELQ